MIHQRRGDGDLVVLQHRAGLVELVHMDQLLERRAAFFADARIDVDGIHLDERIHHPGDTGRAIEMHRCLQTAGPRQPDHVEQVGVVVGVVMGEKDIAQRRQANAGLGQLLCNAVAAVDQVGLPVDDQRIGGRGAQW